MSCSVQNHETGLQQVVNKMTMISSYTTLLYAKLMSKHGRDHEGLG
jgi:hypothetical protein